MELHELLKGIRDAYSSERPVTFYVAAGISRDCPSHLPLGGELRQAVLSGFIEAATAIDLSLLVESTSKRTLEEVCGVVQQQLDDGNRLITTISQALDSDEIIPNHHHRFLARALGDGHIVVTTNYDAMVERAYHKLYGAPFPKERISYDDLTFQQFLLWSFTSGFRRDSDAHGWLLKLHGSFHVGSNDTSHSVATTMDRVGQGLPPKAQEAFIQILQHCPLVVLGYGCMDIDIVYPVLIETASSQPIWWVRHRHAEDFWDHRRLKEVLKEEEGKAAKDVDVQTANLARVLCNRGGQNGGNVWQINALTSGVISLLMAQIGGSFGNIVEPCPNREKAWLDELRQLGTTASESERLIVLAKLAQMCGPYKSGSRDVYDLSNELLQTALAKVDDSKKASIYREMGWNKYRQSPETNAEQALKLYEEAEKIMPRGSTGWTLQSATIQALRALAHRRERRIGEAVRVAEDVWQRLPSFIREGKLPSEPAVFLTSLESWGISRSDFGPLGSVLRRIAGVYDQCVSGPATLATAIRCNYQWTMDKRESKVLEHARDLLEIDRALQQLVGDRRQKIQSENQLGLVQSKLGNGIIANAVHEDSRRVAEQFGWWYEYAQALRNRALAEETSGDPDKAISSLKKAYDLFEGRAGDRHGTLWHIGRIRIRNMDEKGINDIEQHLADPGNSWHWKANDYALLGIGYHDVKGDQATSRQLFASMMAQYPRDDIAIRNQAYGVDNALANILAAIEHLTDDSTEEGSSLHAALKVLRERFEKLRYEALQLLSS